MGKIQVKEKKRKEKMRRTEKDRKEQLPLGKATVGNATGRITEKRHPLKNV